MNNTKKLLTLCLAIGQGVAVCAKDDRPNILFILSDDHSFPDLGCYGNTNVHTPNLDSLAAEGILYTRAYTTSPQSSPSRSSMLTGLSPVKIGTTRFGTPLSSDYKIIPEFLRQNGYFTGICGRNPHLDGPVKLSPTWKRIYDKYGLATTSERVDYYRTGKDVICLESFIEFVDSCGNERPWFLWMNFNDPHRPWRPESEYRPDLADIDLPSRYPDTELVREDLANYYGEINRLDSKIGEIFKELNRRGLNKNTMIIFMGDNGASVLRGKGTLYEKGLNVPLIVSGPFVKLKGYISNALISGEDIAPTILSVSKTEIPLYMTGKSFVPSFKMKGNEGRNYVFAERGAHAFELPTDDTRYFDLSRTVISRNWKLIYNATWYLKYKPSDADDSEMWKDLERRHEAGELPSPYSYMYFYEQRPVFELYNLEKDPDELVNLSGSESCADIELLLKKRLLEWMLVNEDYLPLPVK